MSHLLKDLEEFESKVCPACRHKKIAQQSFCRDCYFKLPKAMQRSLFRRFGDGYEKAYAEAVEWLGRNLEQRPLPI